MNIDTTYDHILASELAKRLGRQPKSNEMVNADNDSDLVNETLWQLIVSLDQRISVLEAQVGKVQ